MATDKQAAVQGRGELEAVVAAILDAAARQGVSCAVIADDGHGMQRDYWYTVARDSKELEAVRKVGTRAGERAVRRLGGRRLSTRQAPVIIVAEVAGGLISQFIRAIRGESLYRKSSFLLDRLGQQEFFFFLFFFVFLFFLK